MSEEQSIGGGFTQGELQFAGFWVRNGAMVRRVVKYSLIGLNVLLWGYASWGLLDAYVFSYPREARITQDIESNRLLLRNLSTNQPRSIQTQTVRVFSGTENRYDMLVPMQNPNDQWYAEFNYRFNFSGESTPLRSGFILPKQSNYLGEFGYEPDTAGSRTAALAVENIRWKRLDPARVNGDYDSWIAKRDAFQISGESYSNDLRIGSERIGRTTFTFSNPTAYGYWNVGLFVILKRGQTDVASTFISLSNVVPGDEREVKIDWFENLPGITETVVVPSVNFLDETAYLPSTKF
ncbi:hypothetical protein GF380_02430 [Candidatus Uhrbacteria bacterium]|nr:hypothetical protein [Candidatus Uhrbacteria bacterium]MBD3284048.1 hypothetical protein [Candidatus Uhrbacteria bacterium]